MSTTTDGLIFTKISCPLIVQRITDGIFLKTQITVYRFVMDCGLGFLVII